MGAPPSKSIANLAGVSVAFADHVVLDDVSAGVGAGERIGIVGANGAGKSTLLALLAGRREPDAGTATLTRGVHVALVDQHDPPGASGSVRDELVGGRADHELAADPAARSVARGLLGDVHGDRFPLGLDTPLAQLSGGERRRIALARQLVDAPDLLLLDEPTNHLDIDGVAWLARALTLRRGALVVVTHDRWFLDEVCTHTWEVTDRRIHRHDGGYAAYVLARAERDRLAAVHDRKRRALVRKELAWLRRGPPARTSKPAFRVEAANALIADEPPVRDSVELARFASSRLGSTVLEAEDVAVRFDGRDVLAGVTWRLGPGDRVALVGANGSGKTTLTRVLTGDLEPSSGTVIRGSTVRVATLSQHVAELPGDVRVLESLEAVRQRTRTSDGLEFTASQLCERFGFAGPRSQARVRDLSGGERRRLQLMRLLMDEPNVLVLDEPTNDLDIDTLTAVEDLLDGWPGTLVVVSHDRYFVERVCDDVWCVDPGGVLRHLPGGIGQYVDERAAALDAPSSEGSPGRAPESDRANDHVTSGAAASAADMRQARKDLARVERQLDRLAGREAELHARMAAAATDHAALAELDVELRGMRSERDDLEAAWLEAATVLGD